MKKFIFTLLFILFLSISIHQRVHAEINQEIVKIVFDSVKIDSLDTGISLIQETIQQQSKEFQLVNEAIADQLKVKIENQRFAKIITSNSRPH
jgi:hypothetical protein